MPYITIESIPDHPITTGSMITIVSPSNPPLYIPAGSKYFRYTMAYPNSGGVRLEVLVDNGPTARGIGLYDKDGIIANVSIGPSTVINVRTGRMIGDSVIYIGDPGSGVAPPFKFRSIRNINCGVYTMSPGTTMYTRYSTQPYIVVGEKHISLEIPYSVVPDDTFIGILIPGVFSLRRLRSTTAPVLVFSIIIVNGIGMILLPGTSDDTTPTVSFYLVKRGIYDILYESRYAQAIMSSDREGAMSTLYNTVAVVQEIMNGRGPIGGIPVSVKI